MSRRYGYKSRNHGNVPPSDPAVTYRLIFGQPIEHKAPPADGVWISVDPVSHYWYTSAQHPLYLMTYFPTAMEVIQDPDDDGKTTAHHWVQPDAIAVNTTSGDEDDPAPPEHQQWFRIVGREGNSAVDGVETAIDVMGYSKCGSDTTGLTTNQTESCLSHIPQVN
jgi:hypothetical protein